MDSFPIKRSIHSIDGMGFVHCPKHDNLLTRVTECEVCEHGKCGKQIECSLPRYRQIQETA